MRMRSALFVEIYLIKVNATNEKLITFAKNIYWLLAINTQSFFSQNSDHINIKFNYIQKFPVTDNVSISIQ